MGGLGDEFDYLNSGEVCWNGDHLRSGDHDVTHLHAGDLQCALYYAKCVSIEHLILFGIPNEFEKAFGVSRLVGEHLRYFIDPGLGSWIDAWFVVSHFLRSLSLLSESSISIGFVEDRVGSA